MGKRSALPLALSLGVKMVFIFLFLQYQTAEFVESTSSVSMFLSFFLRRDNSFKNPARKDPSPPIPLPAHYTLVLAFSQPRFSP